MTRKSAGSQCPARARFADFKELVNNSVAPAVDGMCTAVDGVPRDPTRSRRGDHRYS